MSVEVPLYSVELPPIGGLIVVVVMALVVIGAIVGVAWRAKRLRT